MIPFYWYSLCPPNLYEIKGFDGYSNWDLVEYIPDRIVYGNICWHLSYRTICSNSEIKGKCTRHMWISDSTRKILIHISLSDGLKGLVTNDQTELWEKEKIFYGIRGHFIKGFKAITREIMRGSTKYQILDRFSLLRNKNIF